jgi:hypothetical protein
LQITVQGTCFDKGKITLTDSILFLFSCLCSLETLASKCCGFFSLYSHVLIVDSFLFWLSLSTEDYTTPALPFLHIYFNFFGLYHSIKIQKIASYYIHKIVFKVTRRVGILLTSVGHFESFLLSFLFGILFNYITPQTWLPSQTTTTLHHISSQVKMASNVCYVQLQ